MGLGFLTCEMGVIIGLGIIHLVSRWEKHLKGETEAGATRPCLLSVHLGHLTDLRPVCPGLSSAAPGSVLGGGRPCSLAASCRQGLCTGPCSQAPITCLHPHARARRHAHSRHRLSRSGAARARAVGGTGPESVRPQLRVRGARAWGGRVSRVCGRESGQDGL